MPELRQLRQFVVLAETLHFGRAARHLNMTQPPLSMAMQRLEEELGVLLFERSTRRVELTVAGQEALIRSKALLKATEEFSGRVRSVGSGTAGTLRMGFVSTVSYGPFPDWIRLFKEQQPGLVLELNEATLDKQLQLFDQGVIDVGWILIRRGSVVPGFKLLRLWEDSMMLAIPAGDPIGRTGRFSPKQILSKPIVTFPRQVSPTLYDGLQGWYESREVPMPVAQNAIQMHTILGLVAASIGLAWVPRAMSQLARPGVVYRAIPSMNLKAQTCLIYRSDENPAVNRFIRFLDQVRPKARRQQ